MKIDYKAEYKSLEKEADKLLNEVVRRSVQHGEDLERIKTLQEELNQTKSLLDAAAIGQETLQKAMEVKETMNRAYMTTISLLNGEIAGLRKRVERKDGELD